MLSAERSKTLRPRRHAYDNDASDGTSLRDTQAQTPAWTTVQSALSDLSPTREFARASPSKYNHLLNPSAYGLHWERKCLREDMSKNTHKL